MIQSQFSLYRHLLAAVLLLAAMLLPSLGQAQAGAEYPLGSGDSIHIQVFQNPDLTIDTRVAENGTITFPLVGSLEIGGLAVAAAEMKIAEALEKGGFLQKPQITITLVQVRGNQVSVLGQVNRPGRFPLETANTRLTDMLANAGGATVGGDDVVIVTGVRSATPFRKKVDIPALFLDDSGTQDMVMQGGDVVYVHRAPVFYIYGEAQRPGAYRVERGMTIMQALAQGGGPTARGSEKRLRLNRKVNGEVVEIEPKLTDSVQADDVIFIRESLF